MSIGYPVFSAMIRSTVSLTGSDPAADAGCDGAAGAWTTGAA